MSATLSGTASNGSKLSFHCLYTARAAIKLYVILAGSANTGSKLVAILSCSASTGSKLSPKAIIAGTSSTGSKLAPL